MNELLIYFLSGLLVLFALFSVLLKNALKAVISLAVASALLTTIMFLLKSPLAAVFELSVCAGLITVIFISVISLTKPAAQEESADEPKKRIKRYIYLPFLLIIAGVFMILVNPTIAYFTNTTAVTDTNVQDAIWNTRRLDVLGQIVIILAGVIGVVILFKEKENK
jgi:NADH-quinone oxidoreductase subunit J